MLGKTLKTKNLTADWRLNDACHGVKNVMQGLRRIQALQLGCGHVLEN